MDFKKMKKIFIPLPKITGEGVILREVTTADAEDYKRVIAAEQSYRYWGVEITAEEADPLAKIAYNAEAREDLSEIIFGIADEKTNRLVGEILVCKFDGTTKKPFSICEIGYRVAPKFQGQGYASRAIKALCEFIFAKTDIIRIQALVMKENAASVKALIKAGFKNEGLLRQVKAYEVITDCYMLSVVRRDDFN